MGRGRLRRSTGESEQGERVEGRMAPDKSLRGAHQLGRTAWRDKEPRSLQANPRTSGPRPRGAAVALALAFLTGPGPPRRLSPSGAARTSPTAGADPGARRGVDEKVGGRSGYQVCRS